MMTMTWKTVLIVLLVPLRVTTGYAGIITLHGDESGRVAIAQFLLSTHIGADSSKVGEVMTDAIAYGSVDNIVSGQIIQGATNSAYQCEIVNGSYGHREVILKVKKLQEGYAGEAICVAQVRLQATPQYPNAYANLYVYNTITANKSAYGPSYATLIPYGKKVELPRSWNASSGWDDSYYFLRGGGNKWSATYNEQIQHLVSESHPYVPILTVTDDSSTWAFVAATTKDVDAGFTTAVRITRMGGGPCSWINAGEQCFMYVDKDKLRSGETKGQIVLNIRLP
ncbi:hypothetical protein B4907_20925 [Yersinia kristensenii]|nr:hypothetical protein ykris0001_41300 [Yersinia kristensenii ATCC 33638]OWF75780.1 hypothetical protein B4907_20925 [Yersinia kristensenii]PEH52180.1 hypothetical protein CRM81_01740 [Yersinia kristensenii]SUP69986.1 Uncharacterised protein [Yersinia kristensenii]